MTDQRESIACCPCGNVSVDGLNFARVEGGLECARCGKVGDFEYVRSPSPRTALERLAELVEGKRDNCKRGRPEWHRCDEILSALRQEIAWLAPEPEEGDGR